MPVVKPTKTFLVNVGVDLGGRDVGVAEQRLYHTKVGTVMQEVAGEGVAQHVRAHLRRLEACRGGERFQLAGKMLPAQVSAFAERWKQPFGLLGLRCARLAPALTPPPPAFVLWSVLWIALAFTLAAWSLDRREL